MSGDPEKRLALVRHANAEQDADVRDFERRLSRKGQGEAEELARRFLERGWIPDLILCSAAARTRETAEIFARVLGVAARQLQADDSLYLADGDHIIATLKATGPRVTRLMVVGHNPGISAAAISLAPEAISTDLPTCGTLTVNVACAQWSMIDRRCVWNGERDAPRRFFDFGGSS